MKIAIMSDSHDHWPNLEKAVEMANQEGCNLLLFAGDLVAPPGLFILEKFNGDVKFVWGNNEAERVGMTRIMDASENIELCGDFFEGVFDGVKIFMSHYPRYAQLAAKSGEFDLCIFGHDHEIFQDKVGNCLLISPGEVQGYKTGNSSFGIFNTENSEFDIRYLKKF